MAEEINPALSPDSQWSTYEANVQSYRQLAMAAQSLYLAVGAILLGFDLVVPFFAVFALALVTSWYVFFPAILAREAIVDFHKFGLRIRFDADGAPRSSADSGSWLRERDYADVIRGARLRRRVSEALTLPGGAAFRTIRLTRAKLDVVIPGMVTLVWIIFAVYLLVR